MSFLMLALIHTYFLGTNLNSSIICFLSSWDMYLFLQLAISVSVLLSLLGCFFWKTCYFISNFITNQITSFFCCFLNSSFWCSFYSICCRFFSTLKKFWPYLLLKFFPMFLAKDKNPYLLHIFYLLVQLNISFFYVQSSFNHRC